MMRTLKTVRLAIDQDKLLRYAALSHDFNPIHVDPQFAAATPMGGIIAHGTLSLNLLLEAIERTVGPPSAGAHAIDVRFKRPARIGDIMEAGGIEQADGSFAVWVRNQNGESVIEGVARLDGERAEA